LAIFQVIYQIPNYKQQDIDKINPDLAKHALQVYCILMPLIICKQHWSEDDEVGDSEPALIQHIIRPPQSILREKKTHVIFYDNQPNKYRVRIYLTKSNILSNNPYFTNFPEN